jgi:hypothetical protein
MLVKQRLEGFSGDPFTFSGTLPMMATTFFGGYGLFLWYCTSFLTVFKSFILFGNFFTSKTSFSDAPSSLTNIKNG